MRSLSARPQPQVEWLVPVLLPHVDISLRAMHRPLPVPWPKLQASGTCLPVANGSAHRCRWVHATPGPGVWSWLLRTSSLIVMSVLWTQLLTQPALVLGAPSRSGRGHALRQENLTRRRCMDWISGMRADLWAPVAGKHDKRRSQHGLDLSSDALPNSLVSRVATLVLGGCSSPCLLPPSCKTHWSTPRTTWFQRSAFSTLGLPLRTVWG